jgi:hypothetical protein
MIYDNFYDNNNIVAERVVLSSDIDINVNELQPIKANFYIPILTPTLNLEDGEYNKNITQINKNNIHGASLNTKNYIESNYIELEIPVYILEQFVNIYSNPNVQFTKIRELLTPVSDNYNAEIKDIITVLSNIHDYLKEYEEDNSIITISKGTEFIITGIGTSIEYEKIKIIGIYTSFDE